MLLFCCFVITAISQWAKGVQIWSYFGAASDKDQLFLTHRVETNGHSTHIHLITIILGGLIGFGAGVVMLLSLLRLSLLALLLWKKKLIEESSLKTHIFLPFQSFSPPLSFVSNRY